MRAFDPKADEWAIWWIDSRIRISRSIRQRRDVSKTAWARFIPTAR